MPHVPKILVMGQSKCSIWKTNCEPNLLLINEKHE
jgi:hypothetical protein